jgi:hypothetical protein
MAVHDPEVYVGWEKFAIVSRHVNIGADSNSEVKSRMTKIVIVYSQPG